MFHFSLDPSLKFFVETTVFQKAEYKNQFMQREAINCLSAILEIAPEVQYKNDAEAVIKTYFSDTSKTEIKSYYADMQKGIGNYYYMSLKDFRAAIPYFQKAYQLYAQVAKEFPDMLRFVIAANHRLRQCYEGIDQLNQAILANERAMKAGETMIQLDNYYTKNHGLRHCKEVAGGEGIGWLCPALGVRNWV